MEKFKNFLKRESFYVILTLCLIVLAGVAVVTGGKKAEDNIKKPVASNSVQEKETGKSLEGAELVKDDSKKDTEKKENKENKSEAKKEDDAVATNATPKSEYISPVKDGVVTRKFNIAPRVEKDGKSANVYKGIDIEAKKGSEVLAIADGEVIDARSGDSREGNYVKVKDSKGLITMYGNLDLKLKVKKGDKVSQGTVLGTIGNSIKVNPSDRVSKEYLLLHVEKDKQAIDPLTVFKDLPVKK